MDMRMVDNEENRDDRKAQSGEDMRPEVSRLPNRKTRRMIAKRRGVFKHPGGWPYINAGARKNQPTITETENSENQN